MKRMKDHEVPLSDEKKDKEYFGLQKLGVNVVTPKNEDSNLEEDLKNNV